MQQPDNNVFAFSKKAADALNSPSPNDKMLYQRCEALTISQLKLIAQRMFENADDTLFTLAEKAEKNNEQTLYFDSMRIVRLQRSTIEAVFLDLIKQNFSASHLLKEKTDTDISSISLEGISLVEEGDLEESIAIKNMITKIRYQYAEEITALDKRLALLQHVNNWDEEKNPLGPESICNAFMKATNTLDVGLKISLIILKLFEMHIVSGIKPLYAAVNQLCIEAGVLPKIKLTINKLPEQKPAAGRASALSSEQRAEITDPTPSGMYELPGLGSDNSLSQLHHLLNSYRQANHTGQQSGYMGQPAPGNQTGYQHSPMHATGSKHSGQQNMAASSYELAAFLSGMQFSDIQPEMITAGGLTGNEAVTTIPRGGLKQYVLTNLEKQGKSPQALHPLDNDVIDIVSMLFEYILDDDTMPDAAKALLGKLQIPMLKAAIIDKAFFATKGHPARTLLNEMAKASLAISDSDAENATNLISELKRIVETIITEFKEDLAIFTRLLQEFRTFVAQQDAVEATVQIKVAAKFKQKEDFALASKWVDESLNIALQQRNFPTPVLAMITGPWKQVMLQTYLNQGQDSDTWKNQLRFIEILDWSIQPKRISMDRSKLASVIYHLVNTLRNGLETIGIPTAEIDQTLAQLEPFHVASIKGLRHNTAQESLSTREAQKIEDLTAQFLFTTKQNNPAKSSATQDHTVDVTADLDLSLDEITGAIHEMECQLAALAMDDAPVSAQANALAASFDDETLATDKIIMDDIVLSGYDTQQYDPSEQPQDEYLDLARHLEQGKWVEFTDKNKRKVRAKLAWKSDLLGEFTFLDWKHSVVADKTLYGLAADLRRGTAEIINDIPIMDRALSAVMKTLSGTGKR